MRSRCSGPKARLACCAWVFFFCCLAGGEVFVEPRPFPSNDTEVSFKMPLRLTWNLDASGLGQVKHSPVSRARRKLFSLASETGTETQVRFGRKVVLQLRPGAQLEVVTAGRGLQLERQLSQQVWLLAADDVGTAAREADDLAKDEAVLAAYPLVRWAAELSWPYAPYPDDGLFGSQWSLEQRDELQVRVGADLNARGAWPYATGRGVLLAVADCGVELSHVELAARVAGAPHHNFALDTEEGVPPQVPQAYSKPWAHGTGVAGLAAATLNLGRMVGVAPEVNLASWVVFGTNSTWTPTLVDDVALGDMFAFAGDRVEVQNHSWNRRGTELHPLTTAEQLGWDRALDEGRAGRGAVIVRSAGNERDLGANANEDGYVHDPRCIAVAEVYADGRATESSEPGACLWVAAPAARRTDSGGVAGVLTTDLQGVWGANQINYFPPYQDYSDYRYDSLGLSGTSAAAPQIAGLVALMLEVNPGMTRRDIQQALALSARHWDRIDPGLGTNAAGFVVSHNVGFGVPDAGQAVRLALNWANRPGLQVARVASSLQVGIPDEGLAVEAFGAGVPGDWQPVPGLGGTGLHPDDPTPWLPLVYVGTANQPIEEDLTGKGALILRDVGSSKADLVLQLQRAAQAGAGLGILFNYPPIEGDESSGEVLTVLAGTEFLPMPVIFIGNSGGERLRSLVETQPAAQVRLRLEAAEVPLQVDVPLLCEHVGVRLKTDHPLRGDLRITLLSPGGTRSVLQAFNGDLSPGPVDWTYWSTRYLGEPSVGAWKVCVGDEYAGAVGSILEVGLIVQGVPLVDIDRDGLDDAWEAAWLGTLDYGPRDDPDGDGYSNAYEQLAGMDPGEPEFGLVVDLSRWDDSTLRLSWPGRPNTYYEIWSGPDPTALAWTAVVPAVVPETEWFPARGLGERAFYQVRAVGDQP